MSEILVAEDSPTQTIHIKHILTTAGFGVETAANGEEALRAIERRPPDLVLTDLDMPKLNGLQLVEAVHRRFPRVPVVLMTAFGSDEVAARALEAGAASYVPKRNLDKELLETLSDLLAVVAANKELERLSEFLTGLDARFQLGNDLSCIQAIVAFVQAEMAELNLGDETERIRLGIALASALRNVICYGNLELSANDGRQGGGIRALERFVSERAGQSPYRERNAWLEARLVRNQATFTVGHEGPGAELRRLLEADEAAQLDSEADGGWVLVKSFMDDVTLDADAKQLTMTKRSLKVTGCNAPHAVRRAIVVDDSPTQALDLRQRLSRAGFQVSIAPSGSEAIKAVERQTPDVLLTDLAMAEMDGLELVRRLRRNHPGLPIIVLTAEGSEETAVAALKAGAAGYVAKKNLGRDLYRTLENVLLHSRAARAEQQAAQRLTMTRARFVLGVDPALLPPLIGRLQSNMRRLNLFDETEQTRISMALREALANAVEHGNLEASSKLREDDETVYHRLLAERRQQSPFRERRVFVMAEETRGGITYTIRDEGPGFNPANLPDPTDPANLERVSGRGLLLIHAFMDEVRHNATGNEITMVKRVLAARPT